MVPSKGYDWSGKIRGNKYPHTATDYLGNNTWEVTCNKCSTVRGISSILLKRNSIRCYTCSPVISNNVSTQDKVIDMLREDIQLTTIASTLHISYNTVLRIKTVAIQDNKIDAFESNADLTFGEIAEVVGMSLAEVNAVYRSGLAKLFKLLEDADVIVPNDEPSHRDYGLATADKHYSRMMN